VHNQNRKEAPVRSPTSPDAVVAGLSSSPPASLSGLGGPRFPRALQALHLQPLRRDVTYGVPTADLQLRSFHVRSLEFFCDFALRAAYYLNLPAFGPVPLPRITERWTVPRSHFIFKKSQENFERITYRRLIQIRDGHIDSVQIWLAFLRKHQYPGVGMKANVWEYSKLGRLLSGVSALPGSEVCLLTFGVVRRGQDDGRGDEGCYQRHRAEMDASRRD